jgi:polyisoprenoid-binding protein YceI
MHSITGNNIMKSIVFTSILLLAQLTSFSQTKWTATSGSVTFTIKNMGSTVKGHFGRLNTTLLFSPDKLASSSLRGSVQVGTINTGNSTRDGDLQGDKYFNADQYKLIEVRSTRLSKKGTQYIGTFNVTMKGVSKQVEIPFDFIQHGRDAEFKASFTINRRDFGIGSKSGLAMTMSDDVNVIIDVKARS